MIRKIIIFFTAIFILYGCSSPGGLKIISPIPENISKSGSHVIKSSADLQYMSCDTKSWFVKNDGESYGSSVEYKREWASSMHALPKRHLSVASKSIPFAIMSNNVYRSPVDKPIISQPGWDVVNRFESNSGLALEELHRIVDGKLKEIAVVYKGTDAPSLKDWKANLSIWLEPIQYAEAQSHFKLLIERPEIHGVPITVAGHSLGGGIAINVSLRHSTLERRIRVFTFNTSPRGFYKPINESLEHEIYLLDEKGEFLGGARPFWHGKLKEYNPLTYNFLDFTALYSKPVSEHSIYLFSRALLLVALGNSDEYALDVFNANFNLVNIKDSIPSSPNLEYDKKRDIQLCQNILNQ